MPRLSSRSHWRFSKSSGPKIMAAAYKDSVFKDFTYQGYVPHEY